MGLALLEHIVRGETELSPRTEEGDLVNVPSPGGDRPRSPGTAAGALPATPLGE